MTLLAQAEARIRRWSGPKGPAARQAGPTSPVQLRTALRSPIRSVCSTRPCAAQVWNVAVAGRLWHGIGTLFSSTRRYGTALGRHWHACASSWRHSHGRSQPSACPRSFHPPSRRAPSGACPGKQLASSPSPPLTDQAHRARPHTAPGAVRHRGRRSRGLAVGWR